MTMLDNVTDTIDRLAADARCLGYELVRDPRELEGGHLGLRSADGTWVEFDTAGCTGEETAAPSYGTIDAVAAWLNDQQRKHASMTGALQVAGQLLARALSVLNSCDVPNYDAWREHAAAVERLAATQRYIERKALRHGVAALQDTTHTTFVLGAVLGCLLEHMSSDEWLQHCRVNDARFLGASGRILADNEVCDGAPPVALALTMADGSEFRLDLIEVARQ